MRFARLLLAFGLVTACVVACDSQFGDTPTATFVPPPQGTEKRISQIGDPTSPDRVKSGDSVSVSGAVIIAVDTYNETPGGNAAGTIYVADLGSTEPYSGASLFNPTWVPGNLRVGAGDAFDFKGTYQESATLPIVFAPGSFLVQLSNPIGTFRYEASVPEPTVIDVEDLASFDKGRQWMNMLVTVKNVTVYRDLTAPSKSGRLSAGLLPDNQDSGVSSNGSVCPPFPQPPTLVNELMDLVPLGITEGTKLKSLTGIVTFFCNLHIAPRTPDDVVIAK